MFLPAGAKVDYYSIECLFARLRQWILSREHPCWRFSTLSNGHKLAIFLHFEFNPILLG